jgi:hypothetical protein
VSAPQKKVQAREPHALRCMSKWLTEQHQPTYYKQSLGDDGKTCKFINLNSARHKRSG